MGAVHIVILLNPIPPAPLSPSPIAIVYTDQNVHLLEKNEDADSLIRRENAFTRIDFPVIFLLLVR